MRRAEEEADAPAGGVADVTLGELPNAWLPVGVLDDDGETAATAGDRVGGERASPERRASPGRDLMTTLAAWLAPANARSRRTRRRCVPHRSPTRCTRRAVSRPRDRETGARVASSPTAGEIPRAACVQRRHLLGTSLFSSLRLRFSPRRG